MGIQELFSFLLMKEYFKIEKEKKSAILKTSVI